MINDEGVWNIKMLKRYCIRIMMTCLLAIALCVTWNAFTGVSLLEIVQKYEERVQKKYMQQKLREMLLRVKK